MGRETLQRRALGRDEDHSLGANLLCGGPGDPRVAQVDGVERASKQRDSSFCHMLLTVNLCVVRLRVSEIFRGFARSLVI
jgi:hypothetical protein